MKWILICYQLTLSSDLKGAYRRIFIWTISFEETIERDNDMNEKACCLENICIFFFAWKKMRFHLIYIIRNPIIFFMIASRPIAGHANLCPGSISTKRQELDILLSTVKHEMLHALGFSVSLFAFYRDSEGKWWDIPSLICLVKNRN